MDLPPSGAARYPSCMARSHLAIPILVLLAACGGSSSTSPPPPPGGEVGPAGGTVTGDRGAQLIIPAGALSSTIAFTVKHDGSAAPAFPPEGFGAAGGVYELTPHGTAFAAPATVRVPFDAAQVPDEATPVLFKAEEGGGFTEIPSTVDGGVLIASVSDLSWVIPAYAARLPRMLYASTAAGIGAFRFSGATGAITGPSSTAPAGQAVFSVSVHPSGRFLYAVNAGTAAANGVDPYSVAVYSIDPISGRLRGPTSAAPLSAQAPASQPGAPVFHPSGEFLYVPGYRGGPNTGVSLYRIDATTGALTGPASVAGSGGAPATALAIDPSGQYAYVSYSWDAGTPSGNTYYHTVKAYAVDGATGAFTGPIGSVPFVETPWALAIDPQGRYLFVSTMGDSSHMDQVFTYRFDPVTGLLAYLSAVTVSARPTSLAMDPMGRFLHVGKQDPYYGVNLLTLALDGATGALTQADAELTGAGSMVGPMAVAADGKGDFVFAQDQAGQLAAYRVSAAGALTAVNARAGVLPPPLAGWGAPFGFAVSGPSLRWAPGCTTFCGFPMVIGSGPPGTGGSPPSTPSGRSYLHVSNGVWGGWVQSSPAGVDFGHSWVPSPPALYEAEYATGATVTLCVTPPPVPANVWDYEWSGQCSGTGSCTTVLLDRDRSCHVELVEP